MIEVWKVMTEQAAPALKLSRSTSYFDAMTTFKGDSKEHLSRGAAFELEHAPSSTWNQFCYLAEGVLAISGEACEECEEMYYTVAAGGSELLSLKHNDKHFTAINPTSFAKLASSDAEPFDADHFFAPLFRIYGYPITDIFCMSAPSKSGDDFKKS